MTTVFQFIKNHLIFMGIFVVVVLSGGYVATHQQKQSPLTTTLVKRGDVAQQVSVTGRVNAENEVDLAFQRSGRVATVPRQVGDHVKRGDVLVRLDTSELAALRAQAVANADYENATLLQLHKGTRSEDIAVSQAQVDSAESAYQDARIALTDKLTSAYTTANDALYNKVDLFLTNPRTTHPIISFPVNDTKLEYSIEQERTILESMFLSWQTENSDQRNTTNPELHAAVNVGPHLSQLKDYLDLLATAINALTTSSSVTQSSIDAWKLDVSVARANVNAAVTSLVVANEAANSARSALAVAKNQLALKVAGPTAETIVAQEAKIRGVQASLLNYDAQIAAMTLAAPFSGVVTKQDAKLGQSIAANSPIVSLSSDQQFKIETNVPEADVAKVHIGDTARVTFDAYGPDVLFMATVRLIAPAETIIEGVSTYNVTLYLDQNDKRVRSGMTANIDINTDKREGVLMVPARAITTKDDKKYVRIPSADQMTAIDALVETGLRGSDGNVEVVSGLTEGETIVMYQNTP